MDVVMSRERIAASAQAAVANHGFANQCPPEFLPYKDLWIAEYGKALDAAVIRNKRVPAGQVMSLADELNELG